THYQRAIALRTLLVKNCPEVPGYRRDLGLVYLNMAQVYLARLEHADDRDKMIDHCRRAIPLLTSLAKEFQDVAEYRYSLATGHLYLAGGLPFATDTKKATEHYRQSIELYASLVKQWASVADYRAGLSAAHADLSKLLAKTGQQQAAIDHCRQAIDLEKKLV